MIIKKCVGGGCEKCNYNVVCVKKAGGSKDCGEDDDSVGMSIKVMMAMIQLMLQLFMFLTYSLELQFVEPKDEILAERTKKKKLGETMDPEKSVSITRKFDKHLASS